jgi:hypothetical protein
MTRLQKKILAIIGFVAMVALGVCLTTFIAFGALAFFYHNATDLHIAILETALIPSLFVAISFTLGLLKRV